MKGDNALGVGQAQAWYKSKMFFIAAALLCALLIVSLLSSISLHPQKPSSNGVANFVSFTCRPFTSNQTFSINLEVNLTDGMDQDEAIRVASKVYDRVRVQTLMLPTLASLTANMHKNGVWAIRFNTVYTSRNNFGTCVLYMILNEKFQATINPIDQTVVYSHMHSR